MTDRKELEQLQHKAREAGRIPCNFYINEEGYIDAVFYMNKILDPLTFAEKERAKPAWHQLSLEQAKRMHDIGKATTKIDYLGLKS